jgi:nucleoside-diphosphate-sugar epimerase
MNREALQSGNFVVTGGAGAIGSRLVRRLLDEGAERILVFDDLSSGYHWLLSDDARVQFVEQDVARLADGCPRIESPTVFHLAAFFANQNSIDHPLDDLHTNGEGTLASLLWARKNQAGAFVYASAGCSISGHGIDAPIREDMPVSLHLDTPYQITKALGEFYCNYFQANVPTVRCRFFNSYGPGELPGAYRNVIPNFIWRALHDEPLVITGTGEETRDFIFVDDLVDGLVRAAGSQDASGLAINLGTGVQTRVLDLAQTIIEMCGSQSKVQFAQRRPWDKSTHRQADISLAKRTIGFQPRVEVREGIRRTIGWFRENFEQIENEAAAKQVLGVGA